MSSIITVGRQKIEKATYTIGFLRNKYTLKSLIKCSERDNCLFADNKEVTFWIFRDVNFKDVEKKKPLMI